MEAKVGARDPAFTSAIAWGNRECHPEHCVKPLFGHSTFILQLNATLLCSLFLLPANDALRKERGPFKSPCSPADDYRPLLISEEHKSTYTLEDLLVAW